MKAGSRRHKITLQTKSSALDAYGQPSLTYTKLTDAWGDLRSLNGSEILTAQQQGAEITHKVMLNWTPNVATFGPDDRVVYGNRVFDVLSVLDVEGRRRTIELMLKERL